MPYSYPARFVRHLPRAAVQVVAGVLIVVALLIVVSFFVDGPMRTAIERDMNKALTGYRVSIEKAHLNIFSPSVTLTRTIVRQDITDGKTVALIPKLRASLQWRALLSGNLVSDFTLEEPIINISRSQFQKERGDSVDLGDRGWQEAAQEIFPFKVNTFKIVDGEFTYIDKDPTHPIQISRLNLEASNIRNIHAADREYPSPVHMSGVLFDKGRLMVDGHADFLAPRHPAIRIRYDIADTPLEGLKPIAQYENVTLKGGIVKSHGSVEIAPWVKLIHINDVSVDRLDVDYHHNIPRALGGVNRAVTDANNDPDYILRIDSINVSNSSIGMNRDKGKHPYRLFFTNANARVTNYSNRFRQGLAIGTMQGKFMGTGRTAVRATFRPGISGPNFDLAVAIEDTDLPSMNKMLSAHGKLDVSKGTFAVYSQLNVSNHQMNGYIKPIFKNVTVYNWKQDKGNNVFNQLYQLVVSGVTKLFEGGKDDRVVTRATLSGPVGQTYASTWELIYNAFENAFIKAITPGFDKFFGRENKPSAPQKPAPKRAAVKRG
jgi:hypothetical protein